MFESPRYIRELTGVGVSSYLLKTTSAEHLVAAVRAAVFDPGGENTVIGMPPEMLEETGRGRRASSRPGSWRSCFSSPAASPTRR